MISHKHKCIFIHISKCAGSSIETAFGVDVSNISESNNLNLFGWNPKHKIYLQHATPQELLDYKLISKDVWNEYYKFIIVRNPWERAYSDYNWLINEVKKKDSFNNFLNAKGKFKEVLNVKDKKKYRGDHLNRQIDYFFIDAQEIDYDRVLRFENLDKDLNLLCEDLKLETNFFNKKINIGKNTRKHYSFFYTKNKKRILLKNYKLDLEYLEYKYDDRRSWLQKLFCN